MRLQTNMEKILEIPEYLLLLKARRENKGLTQEELSKELGISPMMLSHLERGKREVKISFLEKWGKELGLEITMSMYNL